MLYTTTMSKPVILTGLRANNDLHIGNYFGALLPIVDMAKRRSEEYDINLFIPDLHSFTTPIDHSQLQASIMNNARVYVAAGLPVHNPAIHLYRQSYIPAHSELTWILDCFTSFGQMSRMTQFKEKTGITDDREIYKQLAIAHGYFDVSVAALYVERTDENTKKYMTIPADKLGNLNEIVVTYNELVKASAKQLHENINHFEAVSTGLFNYPVLMAADILLYDAQYVPVGEDQTQHLEFTRDIAERMNSRFGELFTVPEPVAKQHEFFGKEQGLRIKDLLDPGKKMSKSDETSKGVIFMNDDPETAAKKIMGATTDDKACVCYDKAAQPGISNLLEILTLARQANSDMPEIISLKQVCQEFEGQERYGDFKRTVADEVATFLTTFQKRLAGVDMNEVQNKLISSEAVMNEVANATLLRVQKAVGLR